MALIIIVPGHGGKDPGAIGGVVEKDFNYAMASALDSEIKKSGGKSAIVTSENGVADAVKKCNAYGRDALVVSYHANCCGGTGYESYYAEGHYKGITKSWVELVHSTYGEVAKKWQLRDRGIKSDKTTRYKRLGILQDTVAPSVLLECGFVDTDADTLANPAFLRSVAEAQAKALMVFSGQPIINHEEVVLPDGEYIIVSKQNGKVLDLKKDTGEVILYQLTGGTNQRWIREGNMFKNKENGCYMDVSGGSVENSARIITWDKLGGSNQQFGISNRGEMFAMNSNKVVDVAGGSNENGAQIVQYTRTGGTNQQWLFVEVR